MARKLLFLLLVVSFANHAFAQPYYGINLSYTLVGKEPPTARGFQVMANYDPGCLKVGKFDLYFDGGYSHFWVTNTPYYRTVSIYSIAPVLRFNFQPHATFHPYLELSIGLAYLNHTRLDSRNLGIHFAFQDRIGVGTFVGQAKRFSIGVHAVHYSNASLSEHNSGLTMPVMLDIGYRFEI